MPFKSQAQRRFMYSQHPEIAKEFESKTPKGSKLPEHVSGGKGHFKRSLRRRKMRRKKGKS